MSSPSRCLVEAVLGGCWGSFYWWEEVVDLASQEALEAADDLALRQSFGGAAGDVVDGGLGPAHAHDDHAVERGVGLPVPAAVEAVAAVGLAGPGRNRTGTAHLREGCLGPDSGAV